MRATLGLLFAASFCLLAIAQNKPQPLPKNIPALKALAEKGNAEAQASLGWAYRYGLGVKEDHNKAVEWWRKAAVQGNSHGQFNLGSMTEYGMGGLKKDHKEAVRWYRKAAAQGEPRAKAALQRISQQQKP